jgi:transcription initiation factor TFIIB
MRRARELLKTGKAANVHSGKSPVGLAAAAIYAAGLLVNEELTQETVSEATDVSTVTIRDRYRELLEAEAARDTSATSGSNASA